MYVKYLQYYVYSPFLFLYVVLSAGTVEYTDCTSEEG